MPLNKLDNFIKNVEGRILYVNPNDLDATDSISNQGNSLAQPFKTVQRALLESARFSYLKGGNNDITEKTTILLFPGEHVIDNRPGFAIKDVNGTATAVAPAGDEVSAIDNLSLTLNSNFDLTDADNILYKFNSIHGGVVVPRGTSLVGLDVRKTKIRAKYVPNPTDPNVPSSAIFRITGACYFWQLSFFDGDENNLVYTDHIDFSENNRVKPTFSHHKLTCFEYADGFNTPQGYEITDLDMYYSKLSNAYNQASNREIDQKYPEVPLGFAKQRAEWEIVGAFASDPSVISKIISGDGFTPTNQITVTTQTAHNLTAGTPVKINGISVDDYNISTKVQTVISDTEFTYLLPFVRSNLPATPSNSSGATVTIETDTVSGASPYVFNVSLRSVWGMNGMHTDGSKASGFKSMVVAQFTGVSLQKDDRAFVRYNRTSRSYEGIPLEVVKGARLANESSSTDPNSAYHLNPDSVYRSGWETTHIKASNDAFIQIVSVFAIGFTQHFEAASGADESITNSNSNFGQLSLSSVGFKEEAFGKDNHAYVTSIITPKSINLVESNIDWLPFDVGLTTSVGISSHLYLYGFTNQDDLPPVITQGYRVGAKRDDQITLLYDGTEYNANILMTSNVVSAASTVAFGNITKEKVYNVDGSPSSSTFTIYDHEIQTGEKIRIVSDDGDIPENMDEDRVYYAIRVNANSIRVSSSKPNAENGSFIEVYGGTKLKILSRISDKNSGDIGSPLQYDTVRKNWFLHVAQNNEIYNLFEEVGIADLTERSEVTYFKRYDDTRSLTEKIYKLRVVIPKESINSKNPSDGFVIQETSETGARSDADFSLTSLTAEDIKYKRNHRLIANCTESSETVTVTSEVPHNLRQGDKINIKNVVSSTNTNARFGFGYNGTFVVSSIVSDKVFTYSIVDFFGQTHNVGTFQNDTSQRTTALPRFERKDLQDNFYVYRSEVIEPYVYNVQDGIYHLYVLNSGNALPEEFTNKKFSQPVVNLYPQMDKDNIDENPRPTKTFARRSPVGDVVIDELKNSITRETIDKFLVDFGPGLKIGGISTAFTSATAGIATITFEREHGFNGIVTYHSFNGGTGYTPGVYHNVKLFNNGTNVWDGATAKVVVSGENNPISSIEIIDGGSGYVNGEILQFDTSVIGVGTDANLTIRTAGISTVIGNTLQITGINTCSDGYYRVISVPSKTQVSVAITVGDPNIQADQYAINTSKSITVLDSNYESSTGLLTIISSSSHGLVSGNKIRMIDSSNNNLGDYNVREKLTENSFTVLTNKSVSPGFALKHGLGANDGISDSTQESLGSRGSFIYVNEQILLKEDITNESSIRVSAVEGQSSILLRFPLGSYIQVDNEIMRIISSTLSGAGNDELDVIRGEFGTVIENHSTDSLIRKIKPLAIEFRRPSIIRASGHTFEYLGYGPGNYSTSLPQVQVKTLTEREDFLAQSQEKSSGIVVYTGMNNDGDFFIGNTKYSSTSGQQTTFDIPIPTVTGQDASRLSVIYDEVTVKERILVEGGNSGTILSQFNGPVLFTNNVKYAGQVIMNGEVIAASLVRYTNPTQSTSIDTGALTVNGGVGIRKNLFVGGDLSVAGDSYFEDVFINQSLTVSGNLSILDGALTIVDNGSGGVNLQLRRGGEFYIYTDDDTGFIKLSADSDQVLTLSGGAIINGDLNVTGDITAFYSSDERLKDNIKPIPDALDKVVSISGNTFTWNEKSSHTGEDVGVIAQEVERILPQIVTTRDNGYKAVQYEKLVPLLVEAIKDLNVKIEKIG
jgi:hypothetical protein